MALSKRTPYRTAMYHYIADKEVTVQNIWEEAKRLYGAKFSRSTFSKYAAGEIGEMNPGIAQAMADAIETDVKGVFPEL